MSYPLAAKRLQTQISPVLLSLPLRLGPLFVARPLSLGIGLLGEIRFPYSGDTSASTFVWKSFALPPYRQHLPPTTLALSRNSCGPHVGDPATLADRHFQTCSHFGGFSSRSLLASPLICLNILLRNDIPVTYALRCWLLVPSVLILIL